MYYTNEFIDELIASRVIKDSEDDYVREGAKVIAKILDDKKITYKLFGVYWWGIKDTLRKYVNNGKWYCGAADDALMKERANHGSEFRNSLAGRYYMNEFQIYGYRDGHSWFDKNEDEHDYTLFDDNAGM
jgi:GH35 family endo-1,4-beta-xylanase